jgi:hypothetical protein
MQELHAAKLAAAWFSLEHRLVEQRPLGLRPIGLTPSQLRHVPDYSEHMYACVREIQRRPSVGRETLRGPVGAARRRTMT